ncbi:13623_t:CDS:2, partial [Gigaspora rosea]
MTNIFSILKLPEDILFEITSCLEVSTLINIVRTNRELGKFAAKTLWRYPPGDDIGVAYTLLGCLKGMEIDHFPSNIKAIKLDLSIIDEDNMRVLVSIIKKSPNLTHIDLARNTISNKAVELIVNDLNEHPNLKVLKISGVSDNILFEHPDKMLINETSIDPDLDTSITIELSFMNMRRSVERMGKLQKEITE